MNYQTVLQNYHPTEQGDFMLRYEIGGRGYVVYSPEKDALSCIELHGFSELYSLAIGFCSFLGYAADERTGRAFSLRML